MWLRKGEQVVSVPAHMPETIARCLDEGWVEIPDPRIQAAPEPVPVPPEVAKAMERERIAAIHERNDAARAAFGVKPKGRR